MNSRPLPIGTEIDYCGMRGFVIRDDGGDRVEVDCEGSKQLWYWKFEGVECEIVEKQNENH